MTPSQPGPAPDDSPTTRIPRVVDGVEGADEPPKNPTLLEQMGGVPGILASSIPVAVFVVVNVATGLQPALYAALGAGVAVLVWRLVRRDPVQPAISGLLGVGVCALVARQTGEARGFYLPGLLLSSFFAVCAIVSIVVRWPLAGLVWNGINSRGTEWRRDPLLLHAYTWATAILALVFVSRVAVQGLLYDANAETWLGIARLAMGYPLIGVAILATILIVRRAERSRAVPG